MRVPQCQKCQTTPHATQTGKWRQPAGQAAGSGRHTAESRQQATGSRRQAAHSRKASSFIKKVTDDLNLLSITKILFRLSFDKSVHYSRFSTKNQPFPRYLSGLVICIRS